MAKFPPPIYPCITSHESFPFLSPLTVCGRVARATLKNTWKDDFPILYRSTTVRIPLSLRFFEIKHKMGTFGSVDLGPSRKELGKQG